MLEFQGEYEVDVGSLGSLKIERGRYAYVGSAKAGLWSRVGRHLAGSDKKRWHIDYITGLADKKMVFHGDYAEGKECETARMLSSRFSPVKGFGSSDCRCGSHLFHLGGLEYKD
jgi:Uri superfamily endonuclease